MVIEWCVKNEKFGTRQAVQQAIANGASSESTIQTRRYACLDLCDACVRSPFVLVDNRVVRAESQAAMEDCVRVEIESGTL